MTPLSSIPYNYLKYTKPPIQLIWIVIWIMFPDRNPDHPQNILVCTLARNTHLVFYANLLTTLQVNRRADGQCDQSTRPKHNLPRGVITDLMKQIYKDNCAGLTR